MTKPKRDPTRENRIHEQIIVDAYGPEEQAMGWYYYLEENMQFPFQAQCIATGPTSPLRKGESVEARRLAPEDACSMRHARDDPMARPEHGRPALAVEGRRRGSINETSYPRLALLDRTRVLFLNYARLPKTHDASGAASAPGDW
jgi:hypothetical protein